MTIFTHFYVYDSFSNKMQMSHMDLKKYLEIKVMKKVKETYLIFPEEIFSRNDVLKFAAYFLDNFS